VITDMAMPRVDGPTLIAAARRNMPNLPVICISGYTQESVMREISSIKNVKFLAKPFSLKQLTAKVSEMLDSHAPVGHE
jgi:two-component system, cell cycle sensor histidine kinase and response regulator CckA